MKQQEGTWRDRGFTLIEVLLTVAIISLLGGLVLAATNITRGMARDAQRVENLNQIANAIALYETDSGGVPPGEDGVEYVNGNPEWIPGLVPKYIHAVPSDPVDSGEKKFHYVRQGNNYEVAAFLEQYGNSPACGDGGPSGCQYYEKASGEFLVLANPGASGWRFASSSAVVTLPPPTATTTPPSATTTPPAVPPPPACGITSSDPATPTAVSGASGAPTVTTNAATCIDADSATLNGAVLPNSSLATGFFRYSQVRPSVCTNTLGIRVPSSGGASLTGSFMAVAYNFTTSSLSPLTTYYYCAGGQNTVGTTYGASASFTTTASTTAASGSSISVTSATQPANSTVLQGAYSVPFTNVTISNNSDTASFLYEFTLRKTGTAPDAALKRVLVQTLSPTQQTAASPNAPTSTGVWKLGGRPTYVYTFRLTPGESKVFTVQGEIADDISAYVGQTLGLELMSINVSLPVVGTLPIVGATHTLSVSGGSSPPPATTTPPADTTPPTVSITSPMNGTTTAGTITITASASDNVGVTGVQFLLDGANLGIEDTSSPYSISWNTGSTTNGAHTPSALARDAAGNTATSSTIRVNVSNVTLPPPPPPSSTGWSNVQITNFSGDPHYGEYPALAWNGTQYGVVWEGSDGVSGAENIFFQRLDQNGNIFGSSIKLTTHGYAGYASASAPNIVWSGSRYGIAWTDNTGSGQNLRLMTIDTAGNILSDVVLSVPNDNTNDSRPGLKWTGSTFAVTWRSSVTRYYEEIAGNGQTIVVSKKVASDPEWDGVNTPSFTGSATASGGRIYFSDTGVSSEPVSAVAGTNYRPFITWNGAKYAIVWMNAQNNLSQLYFGAK